MKYSVRGNMNINDESEIVILLNDYKLWDLKTSQTFNNNENEFFIFEVWLDTIEEKSNLFEVLKPFVNEVNEWIDWHECTHDEEISLPCVIAEVYTRGE